MEQCQGFFLKIILYQFSSNLPHRGLCRKSPESHPDGFASADMAIYSVCCLY